MKRCEDERLPEVQKTAIPIGEVDGKVVELTWSEVLVRLPLDAAMTGLSVLVRNAPEGSDVLDRMAMAFLDAVRHDGHLLCPMIALLRKTAILAEGQVPRWVDGKLVVDLDDRYGPVHEDMIDDDDDDDDSFGIQVMPVPKGGPIPPDGGGVFETS